MEIKKNKFKDDSPQNTIYKIKGILNEIGINIYEESWKKINNYCYSVRLEIDGMTGVGVNGKGTSRIYALASAYGELMERLQNRHVIPRKYGLLLKEKFSFPDEIQVDNREVLKNTEIIRHLITDYEINKKEVEELFNKYSSLSVCAPFYHVNRDELALIPLNLLNFSIGTNGMCAGNSPEEAIIHGICELLERYVIKEIVFKELSLPTIPLEEVANFPIYNVIRQIMSLGFKVFIKDCTLGGRFPVVGVLIINKKGSRYILHHGADLIFEIALERCFTEMFQGCSIQQFYDKFHSIEWNIQSYDLKDKRKFVEGLSKTGDGQFPNSIFNQPDEKKYYLNYPFFNDMQNNKDGLKHLKSLLLKENFQIFVRDLSFLNFPTFKVYIPGISEIYFNDVESVKNQFNIAIAVKAALNIYEADKESINILNDELEKEHINKILNTSIFKRMSINISENAVIQDLKCTLFLTLININMGRYDKAFKFLNEFIKTENIEQYSNTDYYMCALGFLKYKGQKIPDDIIKGHLVEVYTLKLVQEVFADLSPGPEIYQYLGLPECPYCIKCPLNSSCNHNIYFTINETLINKMNNNWISQDTIISYFQN